MCEFFKKIEAKQKSTYSGQTVNAGIGIGIGVNTQGNGPSFASEAIAKTLVKVYESKEIRNIILVSNNGKNGLSESEAIKQVLIKSGVPNDHIYLDQTPFGKSNTRINGQEAKRIMDENGFKTCVVIAQQWHAKRVKRVFNKYFNDFVPILIARSRYGNAGLISKYCT